MPNKTLRILSILYFLALVFFTTELFAQTVRYVSPNGNNTTGESWATGWNTFADIEWGDLSGGGTLYLDGGTDSVVYSSQLHIQTSGTAANHVVIRNSYEANHNGRVIIDVDDTGTDVILIGTSTSDNPDHITFKGIEIKDGRIGFYIRWAVNDLIIDSCIITNMYARGIEITGGGTASNPFSEDLRTDSIFIRNSTIITPIDLASETDCVYWQFCTNIYVENNYFHTRNLSPINSHSDVIQSSLSGGDLRIVNNILICDSSAQGMPIIIGPTDFTGSDTVLVYNNYMYMGGVWHDSVYANGAWTNDIPWVAAFNNAWRTYYWDSVDDYPVVILANNTMVTHGPYVAGMHIESPIVILNNIIVQYGTGIGFGGLTNGWLSLLRSTSFDTNLSTYPWTYTHVDSIRNNIFWAQFRPTDGYFRTDGNWTPTNDGAVFSCYDWTDWVNNGGTGINEDPEFVQNFLAFTQDEQAIQNGELQSTSPARNQGEDLQAVIESLGYEWADINGNPRDATPDLGAYEYVTGTADTVPSFGFTAVNNADLSTEYIASSPFDNADSTFTVYTSTGASFKINYNGTYSTASKTADMDDTVYVKNTTGASYSTAYTETIIAGGYSRNFVVTTEAEPVTPPSSTGTIMKGSNGVILRDSTGKIIRTQQ